MFKWIYIHFNDLGVVHTWCPGTVPGYGAWRAPMWTRLFVSAVPIIGHDARATGTRARLNKWVFVLGHWIGHGHESVHDSSECLRTLQTPAPSSYFTHKSLLFSFKMAEGQRWASKSEQGTVSYRFLVKKKCERRLSINVIKNRKYNIRQLPTKSHNSSFVPPIIRIRANDVENENTWKPLNDDLLNEWFRPDRVI